MLCGSAYASSPSLLVYAGSASQPPTELAAKRFKEKTGINIDLIFGGSGYVLSQMKLAKRGDLYFPGSSDYMDKAKRDGDVLPATEQRIVYLVSAINVQAGNPKNIHGLKDLLRPGLRLSIANPEGVCVGSYAVEIIEKNFSPQQKQLFRNNLVNYAPSCSKTASVLSLKAVDAVIGWRVFTHWDPDRIETIALSGDEIARIGYIPIAISSFSKQAKLAQQFIDYLSSEEGQAIFAQFHYFSSLDEAEQWVGKSKPTGGEYIVPADWLKPQ
jgi:molybdate transport system substrate-binding protein